MGLNLNFVLFLMCLPTGMDRRKTDFPPDGKGNYVQIVAKTFIASMCLFKVCSIIVFDVHRCTTVSLYSFYYSITFYIFMHHNDSNQIIWSDFTFVLVVNDDDLQFDLTEIIFRCLPISVCMCARVCMCIFICIVMFMASLKLASDYKTYMHN